MTTQISHSHPRDSKKKIAIITCYKHPDYVRARTLRQALQTFAGLEVLVVKNRRRNAVRYLEVLADIIRVRITQRPDAYLLTFRGYELIPLLQIAAWPKPIIFDEFINLYEWVVEEHQKIKPSTLPAKLLASWWSSVLNHCAVILTDTQAHAAHSAAVSSVPISHYFAVPVGTDETVFKPQVAATRKPPFTVFYYGNMLPLHGLDHALRAAELLKSTPGVEFLFAGGNKEVEKKISRAQKGGARIRYQNWIPFTELPGIIHGADVCLGGPFGNTVQSQFVITGKTYQFLACGAPTIIGASKASGAFADKVNCLVVPQGHAQELADAILWSYTHPNELAAIAGQGRRLFEQQFSTSAVARHLRPALQKVLGDFD